MVIAAAPDSGRTKQREPAPKIVQRRAEAAPAQDSCPSVRAAPKSVSHATDQSAAPKHGHRHAHRVPAQGEASNTQEPAAHPPGALHAHQTFHRHAVPLPGLRPATDQEDAERLRGEHFPNIDVAFRNPRQAGEPAHARAFDEAAAKQHATEIHYPSLRSCHLQANYPSTIVKLDPSYPKTQCPDPFLQKQKPPFSPESFERTRPAEAASRNDAYAASYAARGRGASKATRVSHLLGDAAVSPRGTQSRRPRPGPAVGADAARAGGAAGAARVRRRASSIFNTHRRRRRRVR